MGCLRLDGARIPRILWFGGGVAASTAGDQGAGMWPGIGSGGGEAPTGESWAPGTPPEEAPRGSHRAPLRVRDASPPPAWETHRVLLGGDSPFRAGAGHKQKGAPSFYSSMITRRPANAIISRRKSRMTTTHWPALTRSGGRGQAACSAWFWDRPLFFWEPLLMVGNFSQFHLKTFAHVAISVAPGVWERGVF